VGAGDDSDGTAGRRQTVKSNTDPDIATTMATLDTHAATRNQDGGKGAGTKRPLPPVNKRRRAASESNAAAVVPDTPKQ